MKILFFLLLVLCSSADSIRVIDYNLQGMRPDTNWSVRLFFIIQELESLNPDVICLQEVNETINGGGLDNMALTIAEELTEHFAEQYYWYFSQTHVGWGQFNEGVGIVSRFPILESGQRGLAQGAFPRKVVWCKLETESGPVNAFSTHLSYRAEDADTRLLQASQISEYLLEKEEPGIIASILCGDFNCTPGSPPIQLLLGDTGPGLVDTWNEINPGISGNTVPAENPDARIDFIFYKGIEDFYPDSCQLVMNETYDSDHYTSDHLAVMTDYNVPEVTIAESGSSRLPTNMVLGVPFPNPFNPLSRVKYFLETPGNINMTLFDIHGSRIQTIAQGVKSAGWHEVEINGTNFASAMYLINLEKGGENLSRKVLLIK
jgi:endonuclease/exonuclease/phosphatase family metal-dependent hydrolase